MVFYCRFNLTGHIDSHQLELDSLPGFLSSQLSVDPTFINQVTPTPTLCYMYIQCM